MSSTTSPHTTSETLQRNVSGPTFRRVVAAESTKLLSLRPPLAIGVITVVLTGALTYLFTNASSTDPGFDPMRSLMDGVSVTFLGPLVLGVLVGTAEFGTGSFRSTYAAVPRRLPVLAAQAVVVATFTAAVAVLSVVASVLGILPGAASRDMTPDLLGGDAPLGMLGAVVFFVGTALIGLALGALLRRQVPALVTAVVLLLVLPSASAFAVDFATDPLEASRSQTVPPATAVVNTVTTFTPVNAGSVLVRPGSSGVEGAPDLGGRGAGLVLGAWVAVPLAGAAFRLRRRDLG